ncbi:MAG: hypothetical protein Q9174_002772 [Haloplaca sp. 1 TL-2023]
MPTIAENIELGQFPLQVRPEPIRLRSGNRRHEIIAPPPPSREPSIASSDRDIEKSDEHSPPVDGGPGAWKFLFAAFMLEAFMFGFPLNYGVFQNYYSTHPPYNVRTDLSTVGTLGTCFYFLGGPLATYLIRRYHRWQRQTIWLGFTISIVGLASAGWAKNFGMLVATQGIIYGVGLIFIMYPIFNMMNEWFVDRRGLALGVICAATGFSGLFLPFVLELLLNKYGPATTLRICALTLAVLCGPVLPLLKNRQPPSDEQKVPAADFSFFKMPLFYCFALAGLSQGSAMYFPIIYLPSYAASLGMTSTVGAALLVICSFAQLLGQLGFGYLSDLRVRRLWIDKRVPVEFLVFLSPFVAGISILTFWGMAHSLPMLIVFAMCYGIFGGGFAVLWARMHHTLRKSWPRSTNVLSVRVYEGNWCRNHGSHLLGSPSLRRLSERIRHLQVQGYRSLFWILHVG